MPASIPTLNSITITSGGTGGGYICVCHGIFSASDTNTVSFGANLATALTVTSSTITCTIPASTLSGSGLGQVNVTVRDTTLSTSATLTNGFTYAAPVITAISPASGPIAGSQNVTITGSNFSTGNTVTIGGISCTSVVVVSSTDITAITGANSAGVDTVIVSDNFLNTSSLISSYTYSTPPAGVAGLVQDIVLQTGNGKNFLLWDISAGASNYTIQRSTDGVNFSTVGVSPTNNYLDSAVQIGVNYYYQVCFNSALGSTPFFASYPASITPCLPGQINLGYIRYLAQLRADKLTSKYLTTDEWNSNINQSIYELYDVLVSKYGDNFFLAPPLLISLSGQNSYTLPDGALYSAAPAMYKLSGVDLNISGNAGTIGNNPGWVPLPRANWSDRDKYTVFPGQAANLFYGYQMYYSMMGNQLYVFPPNTNSTLRIWYVPIMTQLLQDTDMLPFSISGWVEYVIIDAAMKAMIKEESLEKWNALNSGKQVQIERIETQAANRDVSMPNTVSNTRSTMGDPSFGNSGGFGQGGFGGGMGY